MMKNLALALYSEGVTDQRFLQDIIRRTSRRILDQYGQNTIKVQPVDSIEFSKMRLRLNECILQAAYKACKHHVLIVHCDADHPTSERALQERFLPGYELVQQTNEHLCKSLVPIVPVQITEAWMLAADHDLLREVMGTNLSAQNLGLVNRARQVEADPNPKQTLKQIMQKAYAERPRRHREADINPLYALLGRQINLDRLINVPSYKQFMEDLTEALRSLELIA